MGLHNILIIGAGVIGGSYLKGISEFSKGIDVSVIEDHWKSREIIEKEHNCRVHKSSEFIQGSFDVILIALPESQATLCLANLPAELVHDETIIVDCCSSKGHIRRVVEKLKLEKHHLSIHPLFGSEKRGYEASSSDMIVGSTVVICTDDHVKESPTTTDFLQLLQELGHHIEHMCIDDHDRYFANTSHLTHVMAVLQKSMLSTSQETLQPPSFSVGSRLSSLDAQLWSDILWHNRDALLTVIHQVQSGLDCLVDALDAPKPQCVKQWIETCQRSDILELYRGEIDAIDSQMVSLLEKRLQTAKVIGYAKQGKHQAIRDDKREKIVKESIVTKVTKSPLSPAILGIYEAIIDQSRAVQGGR